jgi:hypothetical protein
MTMTGTPEHRTAAKGCAVLLGAAALGLFLWLALAPYWSTQVWWLTRQWLFWVLPVLGILALSALALYFSDRYEPGKALGAGLAAVASVAVFVGWLVAHDYQQDRYYARSVTVTDAPAPPLMQRTPFEVSAAQVRPNLGDIPGDVQDTTYLPDLKIFTTPVERRGPLSGYQTLLVQDINDQGRNTAMRCDFSPAADRRFGGLFSHSLARLVNTEQRWVNWDPGDVYGWCDHGTPKIVIPLKEQDGWLTVTERPAGVAVYDGHTGTLEVRHDTTGIPGPTYPLSIAEAQRYSLGAIGGFWDWVWDRAGWELPDETGNINSGNSAEFVLGTPGARGVYVTLLTGRGSATAISAVSVVNAHLEGHGDTVEPLVVHRALPSWLSPTSITDRIRADFGDVFATQRDARIFELAPLGGGEWTATIGLPQNLLYRVRGQGALGAPPCLLTLGGQVIRCGPVANTSGNGPGVALGGPAGSTPGVGSDLVGLPDRQLTDLIDRATREAARRLTERAPR